jgi:hypothetical protein
VDWIYLAQERAPVVSWCEYDIGPSGSMKDREVVECLDDC